MYVWKSVAFNFLISNILHRSNIKSIFFTKTRLNFSKIRERHIRKKSVYIKDFFASFYVINLFLSMLSKFFFEKFDFD